MKGEADFLAAGKRLGMWPIAMSLFATWFGAETIMGSSANVAREGLAGSRADPFGYTICLILMALLIAYRLRKRGYLTIADFFKERYGVATERLGVLIYIPSTIIWSAAQLLAFGLVISTVASIPVEDSLIYSTIFVVCYTSLGGLLGDVVTDVIQGIVLVIGLVILLVVILSDTGGVMAAISLTEPKQWSFVAEGESWLARFDSWMIPILGSLVSQEALSRMLASKDANTARKAAFVSSGIYFVIGFIPIFLALVGVHLQPQLVGEEKFLLELARHYLSPALFIVFLGALISAILSTVDSTLLSAGGLAGHNIVSPMLRLKDNQKLWSARICVGVAGIISYGFAAAGGSIYDLVQTASSFGSAGILVITLIGLWSGYGRQMAALSTLTVGVVVSGLGTWVLETEAPFLTSVAAALTTFILVAVYERFQSRNAAVNSGAETQPITI